MGGDNTLVSGAWSHLINSTSKITPHCMHVESIIISAIEHFPNISAHWSERRCIYSLNCLNSHHLRIRIVLALLWIRMGGVNECRV